MMRGASPPHRALGSFRSSAINAIPFPFGTYRFLEVAVMLRVVRGRLRAGAAFAVEAGLAGLDLPYFARPALLRSRVDDQTYGALIGGSGL